MVATGPGATGFTSMFANGRHVCVGLDTDVERIPRGVRPDAPAAERVIAFNAAVIEATASVAGAYKPNVAFYEGLGADGWHALAETVSEIRRAAPEVPVILDAKRADIGSSNVGYVRALLDVLGGDAVTVHPYVGRLALAPFLDRGDRLIFVLARMSHPGAEEFQDLRVEGEPLFRHVARAVATTWNDNSNCGLVVGATSPEDLVALRDDVPAEMPFLIPGVGAQGGSLEEVVAAHARAGSQAFVINASRSILYASPDGDFADAAHHEAARLHAEIRAAKLQSEPA